MAVCGLTNIHVGNNIHLFADRFDGSENNEKVCIGNELFGRMHT